MKKIPTLFTRDPDNMSRVLDDVNPAGRWVLDGEGVASRKYDGTCMMLDENGRWWARREVKPAKNPPEEFEPIETDPNTGKTVGWEPAENSPFAKFWRDAINNEDEVYLPGTYELCGHKINGNPENFVGHVLIRHDDAAQLDDVPRTFDGLTVYLKDFEGEGIVWHHPDGSMVKIKRRDFGY